MLGTLSVRNLHVLFDTEQGVVHAVRGISFDVAPGEVLGIVGESGCGKSVSSLALLKLLPGNSRTLGEVAFDGKSLLELGARDLDRIRGHDIAFIFQDPAASMNPVHTIGRQIRESLRMHRGLTHHEAESEALRLLERVGIPPAALVQPRVDQCDCDVRRELADDRDVTLGELAPVAAQDVERTHRTRLVQQRHDHRGVHVRHEADITGIRAEIAHEQRLLRSDRVAQDLDSE